jgi:hypothetical protein
MRHVQDLRTRNQYRIELMELFFSPLHGNWKNFARGGRAGIGEVTQIGIRHLFGITALVLTNGLVEGSAELSAFVDALLLQVAVPLGVGGPCGCAVDGARDWSELGVETIELSEGPAVCVLQRFAVVAWLDGGVSQGRRIMECRGIPEDGDGTRRYRFRSQKYP